MRTISNASVNYQGRKVGTIAMTKSGLTVFQYERSWLHEGFSISPISLPLSEKVFEAAREPFDGLFGVFDDCLPDGWGRLLVDRYLRSLGINPYSINNVTRLTLLSSSGLGALTFEPMQYDGTDIDVSLNYDTLKQQCDKLLQDSDAEDLDLVYRLGGSSGGARPKAHVIMDGQSWIVKFPSSYDVPNIGELEYHYHLTAAKCGLDVPQTTLLPSALCSGYFATRRFDRIEGERVHMVSAGGLLEASHRIPSLDYAHLFKLSNFLTKGNADYEKLFTLMCFNEYAHNRDDHAKNFSFLFTPAEGWHLSPVYDLTYSNSLNGEHATTINGKGKVISDDDIRAVGARFLRNEKLVTQIMEKVRFEVESNLGDVLKSMI